MNVAVTLTESASVITGHGETLYFKVLSGGPGIQRWYSMHAMLVYLQLYAHKDNHPLAPIVFKQHPVSFWTYPGLQRDKKIDILDHSLSIDDILRKKK